METLSKITKVKENVLEVDEEGEALCNHEITLTLHDIDRHQYLQLVRQMRAEKPVGLVLTFIQPEMNMEGLDDAVHDALREGGPNALSEASGMKIGDRVRIVGTGDYGEITRILQGAKEPMFWVPTEGQETREYKASEIALAPLEDETPNEEPVVEDPPNPARRSRAKPKPGEGPDGPDPAGKE